MELRLLKALLTAVTSTTTAVHGQALLLVVRACYNIFLTSRSDVNQATAKATLTQVGGWVHAAQGAARGNGRMWRGMCALPSLLTTPLYVPVPACLPPFLLPVLACLQMLNVVFQRMEAGSCHVVVPPIAVSDLLGLPPADASNMSAFVQQFLYDVITTVDPFGTVAQGIQEVGGAARRGWLCVGRGCAGCGCQVQLSARRARVCCCC